MKPLALLAALAALCLTASAEPRLHVSGTQLGPDTTVEILLDKPAAPNDRIGHTAATPWLEIKPAWPGKTVWKEANVLRFEPSTAPRLGTAYQFTLVGKHIHLDGSAVPAGKLGTASTPAFQIEYATQLDRYQRDWSPRSAAWFLRFNDAVEPTAAAPFLAFVNQDGRRVAAHTTRATFGRLKQPGYFGATYTERWNAVLTGATTRTEFTPDLELASGLVVEPVNPLPVGKGWRLDLLAGLPGTTAGARLDSDTNRHIGDIAPFTLQKLIARTVADEPRRIVADFSSNLPSEFPAELVKVTPAVQDLRLEVRGDELHLLGDFSKHDHWTVVFRPEVTARDGLALGKAASQKVEFKHLEPAIGLPSEDEAQLAAGTRRYRVSTVNLESLHVRIKQLSGSQLIRAQQGYRHYTGRGPDGSQLKPTHPIPFEMMSGKTVADLEIPLSGDIDTSRLIVLDWDKLLAGDASPFEIGEPKEPVATEPHEAPGAAFFIDIGGTPRPAAHNKGKSPATQALVQLTDIGLAWKASDQTTRVFAFSCLTGQPLAGVKLETFGEDASRLGTFATDESGLADLPRDDTSRHLRASLGGDQFTTSYDSALPTVGLWRFPVRYSWNTPPLVSRRAFLFSDRSLYRPGETVHLKGIVRQQNGNAIEPAPAAPALLTIKNPTGLEIVSREIEISPAGSFDHSFQLPAETVGFYSVTLSYPEELAAAEKIENWTERSQAVGNARFGLGLRVEEFRRNAFEITHTLIAPKPGDRQVTLDLKAAYYQGQPVARGKVDAYTRAVDTNFYPEKFRDYLFGDHRTPDFGYWYHYFGYRWDDDYGNRSSKSESRQLELAGDGTAQVTAELPEAEFPMAREVYISTEVTDANRQSLTRTSETLVHPASVYAGMKRLDRLVRVGDRIPLEIIAVDTRGEPFTGGLDLTATVSREVSEQVRILNPNGRQAVRNETRREELSQTELHVEGGTEFLFAPAEPGRHTVELRGTDPDGHAFATAMTIHVYGSDAYPWAYEDGMRIKLVPEKKLYRPGDTARVLVLSPIEGTALVTLEREDVTRSFLTELKTDDPVIEIPLSNTEAPNCYVSVLVIKGARDSQRAFKEPQLRLGYCELMVENVRDRLAVELSTRSAGPPEAGRNELVPVSTFLPAEEIEIAGTVRLADGQPAAHAEVTVYAEDEGTLAVIGYDTPAPHEFFYDPRLLRVQCGTSLGHFIPEAPDEQTFYNKGFFIGGGDGDMGDSADLPRRDFNPCAFWQPAVVTDGEGRFSITAKLPDTLTRYRLIAVAHHEGAHFGHAESDFTVSKPLMLEPQTPRFAHETDRLEVQALVQNASDYDGTWRIIFSPNPPASEPIAASDSPLEQQLSLAHGKSATVSFPVHFRNTGEATFTWKAEPLSLAGAELTPVLARRLSDSVENHFRVEYPVPLLRQNRLIRLDRQEAPLDLLADLDPTLLAGRGELELEFSRSLLLEAGGAIDFLLHYPYGCVEQTTSSMIPWIAVEKLRGVSPALAKHSEAEVEDAIQTGIDRLLSMQRSDGGFAYWPDGENSEPWATSYATLGLLLASRSDPGSVPPSTLESATDYLAKHLRELDDKDSSWGIESVCRSLWVLALAEKPDVAYVNKLSDRLKDLSPTARCFLALAEHAAGRDTEARAILHEAGTGPVGDSWMRWRSDHAMELLAWASIDPGSNETTAAIDKLLRDRNPYGHWRTTWVNSWALIALSTYAETEPSSGTTTVTLQQSAGLETGTDSSPVVLDPTAPATSQTIPLIPGLKLAATSDGPAFVRLKLAAKPEIAPIEPVGSNGLEITRFYQRVLSDGSTEPLDVPKVGDLIRVELRVKLPADELRYLVIEDRLPSIFEAVNNDFESQAAQPNAAGTSERDWHVSHSEIRADRVLFFYDRTWRSGDQTLSYLARCVLPGTATAPPAKAEAMYDPDRRALSSSRTFTSQP